jgi:hypothetical protein
MQVDGGLNSMFLGLPLALFGCFVVLCLVAAVFAYGRKLLEGLPRRRGKALVFHKIDDVDEASVQLSARRDEDVDEDELGYADTEGKRTVELSSMRAGVLTTMM